MRYSRRNPATNQEEITQLLKQLLANTYLLYIQTQGAHWNIESSDFSQLHTLFQTQYTELSLATDLIAEHIRTYKAVAPASAGEFLELATFGEFHFDKMDNRGSHYLLTMLIDQHQATIDLATKLGDATANAIHTQNLAADRIAAHEKAIWMLTSSLDKATKASRRRNPVDPSDERWLPASEAENYSPARYDFHWNADYTRFIPIKLKWWDDASYIRYQSDDYQDHE